MKNRYRREEHELVIATDPGHTLLADRTPRGGLLIQIGVVRDGREEWNFVRLPPRFARQLVRLMTKPGRGGDKP